MRKAFLAVLLIASFALAPALSAKETFKARMLTGKSSFEAGQINVRIEVESWTTPEEINAFQAAINTGGYNAFESAFTAAKKGIARFIAPQGRGLTIHAALSIPKDKGRRILLFFNFEPWDSGSQFMASFNANYMVMDLEIDEKGSGEGQFYEFADIKLKPNEGTIEMTSFNAVPKPLPIVQETTKKK